jgi:hypothetical protein
MAQPFTGTEAELMRVCAPLYGSFALESFWTIVLAIFFGYLSITISSKQQIKNPGRAVCKFLWHHFYKWVVDTHRVLSKWDTMHKCELGQRFRLCRRLNATICRIQVAAALLSITRWLHLNNVNGFRYLGYSFTCPLMQAELILLIAPAVPFYKINIVFTMLVTWAIMICGWYASTFEGPLWTTDMEGIISDILDGNFDNLTDKGRWVLPAVASNCFLSLVQMPFLGLCANCVGKRDDMPQGYNALIALTAVSWLGFPCWWFLSYEGAGIISNTKLNGFGFTVLNICAKGGFTLQLISMVKRYKRKVASRPKDPLEIPWSRRVSEASVATLPELPNDEHQRTPERKLTNQSLLWVIEGLREFDDQEPQKQVVEGIVQSAEKVSRAAHFTNEELMAALLRRLPETTSGGDNNDKQRQLSALTQTTTCPSSGDNDSDLCSASARPCRISDADIEIACISLVMGGEDSDEEAEVEL